MAISKNEKKKKKKKKYRQNHKKDTMITITSKLFINTNTQARILTFFSRYNHYRTLGLTSIATHQEIKNKYYTLSQIYHPDKNPDPKECLKFQEITDAYRVLKDPFLRREYDQILIEHRSSNGSSSTSTSTGYRNMTAEEKFEERNRRSTFYDEEKKWGYRRYQRRSGRAKFSNLTIALFVCVLTCVGVVVQVVRSFWATDMVRRMLDERNRKAVHVLNQSRKRAAENSFEQHIQLLQKGK